MTPSPRLTSTLRPLRVARRLSQLELARRAGISRQAYAAVEAGTSVPGTDVALRLAQALGASVESLFRFDAPVPEIEATPSVGSSVEPSRRVTLAHLEGRWVAHPLDPRSHQAQAQAADAVTVSSPASRRAKALRVQPLGELEAARERLVVMGCAPALGLLAARLGSQPAGVRLSWIQGSSTRALEALRRREIHVAGLHLLDEKSGEYNAPVVRRQLPDRRVLLVNVARWEQGLVVAAGNPLRLRGALDLLRPKVRFVSREAGAGAHRLLERLLRDQGARWSDVRGHVLSVGGHLEVAQAIALGAADAGIAFRGAALAYGLDFLPLAEERFDLAIPHDLATDARVERMVDVLGSRAFRLELESAGGYQVGTAGQQVGQTHPA